MSVCAAKPHILSHFESVLCTFSESIVFHWRWFRCYTFFFFVFYFQQILMPSHFFVGFLALNFHPLSLSNELAPDPSYEEKRERKKNQYINNSNNEKWDNCVSNTLRTVYFDYGTEQMKKRKTDESSSLSDIRLRGIFSCVHEFT